MAKKKKSIRAKKQLGGSKYQQQEFLRFWSQWWPRGCVVLVVLVAIAVHCCTIGGVTSPTSTTNSQLLNNNKNKDNNNNLPTEASSSSSPAEHPGFSSSSKRTTTTTTTTVQHLDNTCQSSSVENANNKSFVDYCSNDSSSLSSASSVSSTIHLPPYVQGCGLWLAPSFLEGAGFGTYAGRYFAKGESLYSSSSSNNHNHPHHKHHHQKYRLGDLAIPFLDEEWHNADMERLPVLPFDYVWSGSGLGMAHEGWKDVRVVVPGIPSSANALRHDQEDVNIDHGLPKQQQHHHQQQQQPSSNLDGLGMDVNDVNDDDAPHYDFHRSRNPASGSYTSYYDLQTRAKRDIVAGEELFIGYYDSWFDKRKINGTLRPLHQLLLLPKTKQHPTDDSLSSSLSSSSFSSSGTLTKKRPTSRTSDSRPTRTMEWLWKHGSCADLIYGAPSTIPQAGQGAFASCDLPMGATAAIMPLIHITNRSFFSMVTTATTTAIMDTTPNIPNQQQHTLPPSNKKQLWTNYCFGHRRSTLFLCPYTSAVSLINHNRSRANVKLVWADPTKSIMEPSYLDKPLGYLDQEEWPNGKPKLAFALVVTRPIRQHDEVFLDYGAIWETAWTKHVQTWKAVAGATTYLSAMDFTRLHQQLQQQQHRHHYHPPLLRDIHELQHHPYPDNLQLECHTYFWTKATSSSSSNTDWRTAVRNQDYDWIELELTKYPKSQYWRPCEITQKTARMADEQCHHRPIMTNHNNNRNSNNSNDKIVGTTNNYDGQVPCPELYQARMYAMPHSQQQQQSFLTADGLPYLAFRLQDKPYTSDMSLPNAFRHYIPIPDDLFPPKWQNNKKRASSSAGERML